MSTGDSPRFPVCFLEKVTKREFQTILSIDNGVFNH